MASKGKGSRGAITYTINGRLFSTQRDVMEDAQLRIDKYDAGTYLEGDDLDFFLDLFTLHPTYDIKKGPGIERVEVRTSTRNQNQKNLWLHRYGLSTEDISWHECVHPKEHKHKVSMALRDAVNDQIIAYKNSIFGWPYTDKAVNCAYSGVPIHPDEAHVDHIPPDTFDQLVQSFLASKDLRIEEIGVSFSGTGQLGRTLEDASLLSAWQSFHRSKAKLRVVKSTENLSSIRIKASVTRQTNIDIVAPQT